MLNRIFQLRIENFVILNVPSENILGIFYKLIHVHTKYMIKTSFTLQIVEIQILQEKQSVYIILQNKKLSKIPDIKKSKQHFSISGKNHSTIRACKTSNVTTIVALGSYSSIIN